MSSLREVSPESDVDVEDQTMVDPVEGDESSGDSE